jgi:hypothetical protein
MTKQIKWKFKGLDLYFVSQEEKLERDQLRHRSKLGTKAKIEIIDDNFTLNESDIAGCSSCERNAILNTQPPVSVDAEQTELESETPELLGVFIDVEPTDPATDLFPDGSSTSDDNSTSDSVASEPN